jgi:hypothetical protein
LAENEYLTYVIETSSTFEDVLEDIYEAIEEGSSVDDAVTEYTDDLDDEVVTAAYAITDIVVQELEDEVESENI